MTSQIPAPKYRRLTYRLQGQSWWRQLLTVRRETPRLELLEDWLVSLEGGLQVVVPKGFVTDGASIPRLLWPLISPFGPLLEGAILHDFGYQHGYLLAAADDDQVYNLATLALLKTRPEVFGALAPVFIGRPQDFFDDLLPYITVEIHGATLQATVARRALRWFGHWAWTEYRLIGPGAFNNNSLNLPGVKFDGQLSRVRPAADC